MRYTNYVCSIPTISSNKRSQFWSQKVTWYINIYGNKNEKKYEASKETIVRRLQVQSWLQESNNTGILSTYTWLWLMESEQAFPMDSIKDMVQSSM